ncbi:MAG: hypothetical protein ACAH59_06985 [Pseudobdellovibrionaceae bacterium]
MAQLTEPQKQKIFWISFPALCLISVCLALLTAIPSSREFIRSVIVSHSREILAKAEADLTGQGMRVAVIKVQTSDTLALEIYETEGHSQTLKFVKRIVLPEKRDAYFNFRGSATNLVITDVDGDGQLEIVVPAFDENLVPRLNVYKYDADTRDFIRLGPETYQL